MGALLGEGGMGAVYEGTDVTLGRPVALKVMTVDPGDTSAAERFFREAAAAAKLAHPHIVQVTDFCPATAEGAPAAIVMERLKGRTLADEIGRRTTLPPARALAIASQCASALAAAHEAGLVHRDVKPANVFLVETQTGVDVVKLLDFGVAKFVGAGHTTTGAVLGTIAYMSPEQAIGSADLGPPSDVWSLGVVLYQALTGRFPVVGRTPGDVVASLMRGDLTPIAAVDPSLGPEVVRIVEGALAISPRDRFADGAAMLAAIEAARGGAAPTLADSIDPAASATATTVGLHDVATTAEDAPRPTAAGDAPRVTATPPAAPRRHGLAVVGVLAGALVVAIGLGAGAAAFGSRAPKDGATTPVTTASSVPEPADVSAAFDAAPPPTESAATSTSDASSGDASAPAAPRDASIAAPLTPSLGPWSTGTYRSDPDRPRDLATFQRYTPAITACLRGVSLSPCVGDTSPSMTLTIFMNVDPATGDVVQTRVNSMNCWVGGRPKSPDLTKLTACVVRVLDGASFGPPRDGKPGELEIWAPIRWR